MALRTRGDAMPYHTGIETTHLARASKIVSAAANFPVQYNKAIVGKNAFAHESGIHQDGMLKNAETYEIMTPASVGIKETTLVMGKHSGRAAFKDKLRELGYDLGDNAFQEAFVRFKDLADRKKHIYDADIVALVDDEAGSADDRIKLVDMEVVSKTGGVHRCDMTVTIDGKSVKASFDGTGSVDAIFNAIKAGGRHAAASRALRRRRRHRRHRRAGERACAARAQRPDRLRQCGRARYAGGLGARLPQRGQPADDRARRRGAGRDGKRRKLI